MPRYEGRPSSEALARWSADPRLVGLAEALAELDRDPAVRVLGAVAIHDGGCDWPLGRCDCEPLHLRWPLSW
jgi:hypothetical protein